MPEQRQSTRARTVPLEHVLTVHREGDLLTADWDRGDAFTLHLPLAKADLDEVAWYLERYSEFPGAGDRARAAALEQRLVHWGLALWQAIFPGGDHSAGYGPIRERLDRGQPILLTLASNQPDFLIRPWEMLRDPRGPLTLRGLSLRRRLIQSNTGVGAPPTGLPLRLLVIVSRPQDTGFIDPRTSTRPVLDALTQLGDRVLVDFCEPPTLTELERRLTAVHEAGAPYHIVHFDGHGQYDPEKAVGVLCFERVDGKTDLVEGQELGALLSRFQVPLVLLEACRGAQVSDRPVFGAVAPALLQSRVGSVIAFSHSVHVAASQMVSERFYRALAGGATIGESLHEARAALYQDRRRWLTLGPDPESLELQDWIIPQLYQSGEDPALVPRSPVGRGEERTPTSPWRRFRRLLGLVPRPNLPGAAVQSPRPGRAAETPPPGFPPAPRHRFHGRAREILDLERMLRNHSGVLLHAGGGMGKTALAREAAHWWLRTGRFERALFHSFEQGAGAEAVVRLIGESLGGEDFLRLNPDAQWAESVRLFRRSPVLLVWDNFESVLPAFANPLGSAEGTEPGTGDPGAGKGAHSRPYESFDADGRADLERLYHDLTEDHGPTGPRGRLLVTCRPGETGLAGIQALRLSGLARPDALHLLRGIIERHGIDLERPGYEREEIDALLDRLEDHPLSIELVGPHLKELTPRTLRDELARRLDQFQDSDHAEGRNRSLLASLDFSLRHLSPSAREALPWLGWFDSGVFETSFLYFSQFPEATWSQIRAELATTALLRVEGGVFLVNNRPYLKFHPTLADVAAPDAGDDERVGRFVDVYLGVRDMIDEALSYSQPAAGMALMGLEQSNLRRAMTLAFRAGRHRDGGALAETLRNFLVMTGRSPESDRLTAWIREQMPKESLDGAVCAAIIDHAWSIFTQGQPQQALKAMQDLERRLCTEGLVDGDPAVPIALTRECRGAILHGAGRSDLAIDPLEQAIASFRALGDKQFNSLSSALGTLASALSSLGRYGQALSVANEGVEISRSLGQVRDVAAGLGRIAAILTDAGCYAEAEARYGEALENAARIGDLALQGSLLQHLGLLQRESGRIIESINPLRRALRFFQQSGDRRGEMQTCDLLGGAEQQLGRLDAAEAWHRKSLELARALGDQDQIAVIHQNLGILLQTKAKSIPQSEFRSEPAITERDKLLAAAVIEIESSLVVWQEMGNHLGAASSHFQLGVLQRLRGDLERAECDLQQALAISEPLGHPNTWKICVNLAEIARARGDAAAAADWQAKADAKRS